MFEVIPVLDLKNNIAVSGKSGQRDTYTPLKTVYANSSNPLEIAQNLKFNGANRIYIADLDLIEKQGHNIDIVRNVNMIMPVVLDAGIKNFESFKFYLDFAYKIIVATETLESIDELEKILKTFPKERIVLSIDVKDNELYSKNLDLSLTDFKDLISEYQIDETILLDITSVGTGKGYNKDLLDLFSDFKDKIILGGGINPEDINDLEKYGVNKAIIGTNLHNGNISL